MTMIKHLFPVVMASVGVVCLFSGCVTTRTVTQDGQVISEKNIVKRPVKNLIENTEFE